MPHDIKPADRAASQASDRAQEDAEYYRKVLHELIGMGVDFARMLHGQAKAEEAAPALAAAFGQVSRCVRRTVMLARKVAEPVWNVDPAQTRIAARKRILRAVEDAIQREAEPVEAALNEELRERMDAPDLDDDISQRPVADIIADICRDLGLGAPKGVHPWKRRTPADVAELCARAAGPSRSPADASPTGTEAPPGWANAGLMGWTGVRGRS